MLEAAAVCDFVKQLFCQIPPIIASDSSRHVVRFCIHVILSITLSNSYLIMLYIATTRPDALPLGTITVRTLIEG